MEELQQMMLANPVLISAAGFSNWSRGCRHFLSFVFGVDACFVFDFIVFYLWVNSDNITHRQRRHTAWFQIPYLGSCPPSIDQKLSLISSAKCLASLIREPVFFQIYTGSLEFSFKLIVIFFQKSMQILFTDRVLPTIRRMDKILGKVSLSPYTSYSPENAYGTRNLFANLLLFNLSWALLRAWRFSLFRSVYLAFTTG